jgi:ATP phosphoribosyltransferase regulatory subunit HisZ
LKLEHEIPTESKLYFGESAKRKRAFEDKASQKLLESGFEEIVTPLFSYHQRESMSEKDLIALRDEHNYPMHLRADSTIDVAKLVLKRVGTTDHKQWFYIQPVYRFPSSEHYQIGAETLGETDIQQSLQLSLDILGLVDLKPTLQISNIKIPRLIAKNLDLPIEVFKQIEVEKIAELNIDWLTELLYLRTIEEARAILPKVPDYIQCELRKIVDLVEKVDYQNLEIAPLFYAQMEYYDNVFFRIFSENSLLSRGGCYSIEEDKKSVGFSIYTDEVLQEI